MPEIRSMTFFVTQENSVIHLGMDLRFAEHQGLSLMLSNSKRLLPGNISMPGGRSFIGSRERAVHGGTLALSFFAACLLAFLSCSGFFPAKASPPLGDISVRFELQHAIDLSLNRLGSLQCANGGWGDDTNSLHELTAWVLLSAAGDPEHRDRSESGFKLSRALELLAGGARTSTGLLTGIHPVRTTAASLVAFRTHPSASHEELARSLSDALVLSASSDGGWNSGDPTRGPGSDIGSTTMALRALYLRSETFENTGTKSTNASVAATKARGFLLRSQSFPVDGTDSKTKGSFRSPEPVARGSSRFLETCEGILGLLYSGKSPGDPQIVSALDWIADHYGELQASSAKEVNTYRLYYTFASVMSVLRVDVLNDTTKRRLDWRYDVVRRLSNLQETNGEWGPASGTETERVWCTAFSTLAMEIAFNVLDH